MTRLLRKLRRICIYPTQENHLRSIKVQEGTIQIIWEEILTTVLIYHVYLISRRHDITAEPRTEYPNKTMQGHENLFLKTWEPQTIKNRTYRLTYKINCTDLRGKRSTIQIVVCNIERCQTKSARNLTVHTRTSLSIHSSRQRKMDQSLEKDFTRIFRDRANIYKLILYIKILSKKWGIWTLQVLCKAGENMDRIGT